jgi:hypothetical protein
MLKEMAQDAVECFRTPGRRSVWSSELRRYVCPDSEEGKRLTAREKQTIHEDILKHPPLNKMFKLVFLTAAIGTLFFITLCLVLTLLAGKEPPPLFEKMVMGFFDLAKIGFGSVVGLLGGRKLQAESNDR